MGRKVTTTQKKEQKEQKNSKSESVQHKESSLVQQQQCHPLDLEVDLGAEIRSKELSTIEEIKEYAVKLSKINNAGLESLEQQWNCVGPLQVQ